MSAAGPSLLLFVGGVGGSEIEDLVAGAQHAAALDTLAAARASGAFDRLLLVTDAPALAEQAGADVTVELVAGEFHFGRRLTDVVRRHRIERAVYLGGGGLPLLDAAALGQLAQQIARLERGAIANNLFSADLVAFAPAAAIAAIPPPARDNSLCQLLRTRAGLPVTELPRSAATLFDLDTPTDLLILQIHPGAGPHARCYLEQLGWDTTTMRRAGQLFTQIQAQVVVAGRVSSALWSHLERETACRVRVIAEERGMEADGRVERGLVRSLLGFHLEAVGLERFFAELAELGDAIFLDSRVLLGHRGHAVSRADRFWSDLGVPERIADPFLRAFTAAARAAPVPVILGGHSLVAGGLWALNDAAWLENDRRLAATGQ